MKNPERNEKPNKMSNFNASNVPIPTLTRSVCYLPEHYHPYLKHSDEPNCLCSFCAHKRFVAEKEMELAIKELPQIQALDFDSYDWSLVPGKLTRLICDDGLSVQDDEEIQEEEILLQPVSRCLDMPIPKLSRSTNDPSTWETDEEEILLTGLRL
jgi:hypothetical protein